MTPRHSKVLIVDDTLENLRVLGETLELDGIEVHIASDGEQAIQSARNSPPELILLDVMMPRMNGHEVCARLKQDPLTKDIPVIFLTALNDESDEAAGLDLGAVDYITKPFKLSLVRKRVNTHLQLHYAQEELKRHAASLETTVAERTRELAQANQGLVQADASKTLFLKLLVEEIKAPATGLIGIAQLALLGIEDQAKRQRFQQIFETNRARIETLLASYQRLLRLREHGPLLERHPCRLEDRLAAWQRDLAATGAERGVGFSAGACDSIVDSEPELLAEILAGIGAFMAQVALPGGACVASVQEARGQAWLRMECRTGLAEEHAFASIDALARQEAWREAGAAHGLALDLAEVARTALGMAWSAGSATDGTLACRLGIPLYQSPG